MRIMNNGGASMEVPPLLLFLCAFAGYFRPELFPGLRTRRDGTCGVRFCGFRAGCPFLREEPAVSGGYSDFGLSGSSRMTAGMRKAATPIAQITAPESTKIVVSPIRSASSPAPTTPIAEGSSPKLR